MRPAASVRPADALRAAAGAARGDLRRVVATVGAATVVLTIAVGTLLLLVPGLVVFTLAALVGPVVEIERRGSLAAVARSWRIVRHRFWTVALLFTAPFLVGSFCSDVVDPLLGVSPAGY